VCPSKQAKRDVRDSSLTLRTESGPTLFKHLQHRDIVGKDLGYQFLDPVFPRNRGEMAQQCRSDALSLVLVDNDEGYLGPSGLHDDVTSAPNNHGSAAFFHHCDQGHVVDEVHVQEERDFLFRKFALWTEESAVERLGACALDGCDKLGPIVRPEGADFNPTSIAQQLNRGIPRCCSMASTPIHGAAPRSPVSRRPRRVIRLFAMCFWHIVQAGFFCRYTNQ
jgi:hypothetical protein